MAKAKRRNDSLTARRHRARKRALQAVYQWQITEDQMPRIIEQFVETQEMDSIDVPFFERLALGVVSEKGAIDEQLKKHASRDLEQLDAIELAALRIGVFELAHCPETPYRVVLNEAVELAKVFGSGQGQRMVNGVLDKLGPHYRQIEVQAEGDDRS